MKWSTEWRFWIALYRSLIKYKCFDWLDSLPKEDREIVSLLFDICEIHPLISLSEVRASLGGNIFGYWCHSEGLAGYATV